MVYQKTLFIISIDNAPVPNALNFKFNEYKIYVLNGTLGEHKLVTKEVNKINTFENEIKNMDNKISGVENEMNNKVCSLLSDMLDNKIEMMNIE